MTHREKIDAMYRHLPRLGLGSNMFAPPLYRLLWSCGFEIAPPYFTPFAPLALAQGIFFGLSMGLALMVANMLFPGFFSFSQFSSWEAGMWGGAAYGLLFAAIIRFQANRLRLPLWNTYAGSNHR